MSRLKDNLRMHWPLLVGLVLFIPAAWKYYTLGRWEAHVVSAAIVWHSAAAALGMKTTSSLSRKGST